MILGIIALVLSSLSISSNKASSSSDSYVFPIIPGQESLELYSCVALNQDGQAYKGYSPKFWNIVPLNGTVNPMADGPFGQIGDKLYLLGGSQFNYANVTSNVYVIDLSMNTMELVTNISGGGPGAVIFSPASVVDEINMDIYVYGGWYGGSNFSQKLWKFNTPTRTWTFIPAPNDPDYFNGPGNRTASQMILRGRTLYIYGGFWSDFFYYDDAMFQLNLDNITEGWKLVQLNSPAFPAGRSDCIWLPYQNKGILFGGALSGSTSSNEVWEFDFSSNTWLNILPSSNSPNGPFRHTAGRGVIIDQYLYTYGGASTISTITNDLWIWDIINHRWILIDNNGSVNNYRGYVGVLRATKEPIWYGGFTAINSGASNILFYFKNEREPVGCVIGRPSNTTALVKNTGTITNPSWMFDIGLTVYLEANGTLTQLQTIPFSKRLGIAINENTILF